MSNYHRLLQTLVNRPLFAHPSSAVVVFNSIAQRAGLGQGEIPDNGDMGAIISHIQTLRDRPMIGGTHTRLQATVEQSQFAGERVPAEGDTWRDTEPFLLTRKGTALMSITGSLVNRGAYVGAQSGVTSYEGISYQLDRFVRSSKAANLVIDMSTPGGEALGNAELAEKVRKVAQIKPVFTIINSLGCSAGYFIASGGTEVYGTQSALIGSIGCMMLHLDMTEAAKQQGVKPTIITAGDHKADGHHLAALEGAGLERLKNEVNTFYDIFLSGVAKGRGEALTKAKARETQALTYIGKQAVTAGLIDDIGSFDEVVAMAEKQAQKILSSPPSKPKGASQMSMLTQQQDAQNQQPTQQQPAPLPPQQQQPAPAPAQPQQQAQPGMDSRTAEIISHSEIVSNNALLMPALTLAQKSPGMSTADIVSFVKQYAAPAPVTQQQQGNGLPENIQQLQQRVTATGANDLPAGGGGQNQPQQGQQDRPVTAESHPWSGIVSKVNERASGFPMGHPGR